MEVDQSPMMAMCRFGSRVTWLAEQFAIRQWPSARVHWEVMNNEDHATIAPRAISAGLRSVHRVRPGVHDEEIRQATEALMAARRAAQSAE
ncbi:MAG: hypothetical protein IPF47_19820 [Gemmatimonadetes bacterium]|nr:hypothetical protein [Gemmatimonadota bacterium]